MLLTKKEDTMIRIIYGEVKKWLLVANTVIAHSISILP